MNISGLSPAILAYAAPVIADAAPDAGSEAQAIDAAHLVMKSLDLQTSLVSTLLSSTSNLGRNLDVRV